MIKIFFKGIIILMFFFKSNVNAEYEKIFFDFKIENISGGEINFKEYENKVILLVNTASFCGFTQQYAYLQKLWNRYKKKGLIVLGVPSNSFNQESKTNESIKEFCEINFSIDFPLTTLTSVKGDNAHEIFKWAKKIMVNQLFQNGIFIKF